ncbi:MAG: fibronectin type III domain-containing protein, partial [Bacteroidales bacterium]|nr:fibronectin type III domain-containing protein [Bacteroidales bacterium]
MARTLECGNTLAIFDRGGADADGVYAYGYATTNWYYLRTEGTGTPIHIQIDASLATDCSLTVFEAYPTDDQAVSPNFPTNYPGTYGIYQATAGTSTQTLVSMTGKVSIRFSKSIVSAARTCNYRILVWTSDTSEIYNITNSNITSTSAQLSWSDSSAATAWTVRYGTSANNLTQSVAVTSPTATLTGLTPNTPYYFRVYNNAQTTEELSGHCTRNDGYFITQGTTPAPVGCLGDFTDLASPHVICTYGHYDNPDENYGIASGRHTVIADVDGRDPIIGDALRMVPEGATSSVRLGNSTAGNQSESVIYRFLVDASQNDMLLLQYAAVLQNPAHQPAVQPRLSLQILRADGSEIDDDCYKMEFVASAVMSSGVQWQEHVGSGSNPTPVHWHDWTSVGVDLTQLDGQEIYIKLTTRDCNESPASNGGAHYGYAYFTLECCKKSITYVGYCGENETPTLVAPAGFSYDWHRVGETQTLSTDQEFTIPNGSSSAYECTMTFYGSVTSACSFSMTADPSAMMEFPQAGFNADTAVAAGSAVAFVNTSYLSRDQEGNETLPSGTMASCQWTFGDGGTSTEEDPIHQFPALTNDRIYTVTLTVTSESGCQSRYQRTILVYGTGEPTPYNDLLSDECLVADTAVEWADPEVEWISPDLISTYTIPLVGDLNGDGHPNIVCFGIGGSSETKMINSSSNHRINRKIVVYDGVTKEKIAEWLMSNHTGNAVWADEFSVAPYGILRAKYLDTDIDTGLIIVATTRTGNNPSNYSSSSENYYLQAYDIHGTNIWTSSAPYGADRSATRREYPATVSFADFNGDGYPEVYVRNKIFDAATGQLLLEATSTNNNEGDSWAHKCGSANYNGIVSAPFAADLSGDGQPELILGNEAFLINIVDRTGTVGNSATLYASHTPPTNYSGISNDGHTQVADFNGDGYLDVFISSRSKYTNSNDYTYYYVWDVHNDLVSSAYRNSNNNNGKSIPLIADIDNDDTLEVVVQHPCGSGNRMKALKFDPDTRTFTELWGRSNPSTIDDSWSNTVTLFDFNGDGVNELLFSGKSSWYVLDGTDGHEVAVMPFSEVTIMDYPVIADVDNDGAAEIVTIDRASSESGATIMNGHLHIFQSSGTPWKYARPVWNQYMYNATCVNRDLTIPAHPVNNALVLTDPEGVTRQPFNNFLQQVGLLDLFGRPSQYAADLTVEVPNGATQTNETLSIPMHLCNEGMAPMQAPFSVAVYSEAYRGVAMDTVEIDQTIPAGGCIDVTIELSMSELCDLPTRQLLLAANDNGGGIAQHGNAGQQSECDTINNRFVLQFNDCQVDSNERIEACDSLTWRDGMTYTASVSGPTFVAQGNNGDPDTLYTLYLTINYSSTGDTTIVACDSLTWQGATYTESITLNSQLSILNSVGCDSTVTLHLTINHRSTGDTTAVACDHFTWWNADYTDNTDGITHTYTGPNGCDSVVMLHLTVNHSSTGDTTIVACDSLTWQGVTYTESTTLNSQFSTLNSAGCDSTVTLYLTVNHSSTGDTTAVACDHFTWWNTDYTDNTDGVTHTYTGPNGCDLVVTLHLTVNYSNSEVESVTACNQYVWHQVEYTENTDTATYRTLNAAGCDSVVTLHLTLLNCSTTSITACDSYSWHGQTYTTSNIYVDGNDTLDLTINYSSTGDTTVVACDSFIWHGAIYTESITLNSQLPILNSVGC